MRLQKGFSLIETLVVLAIISILMALYLPTLSKVMRKAKEVAVKEGLRQNEIGKAADVANLVRPANPSKPTRDECRQAFLQDMGEFTATQMLYACENDAQFAAYWHTLLNPDNSASLQYSGGDLVATDEDGNTHYLRPLEGPFTKGAICPVGWEFISTDLTETSSGTIGSTVIFSDGHSLYVRYPGDFPITRTVAELSHRFVQDFN